MREFAKDFICAVFIMIIVGVIFFYITMIGGVGMEGFTWRP